VKPISIIVPTLNEQSYLPILLQSFLDHDYEGEYEIIVIDGNSTDETVKVAKGYQTQLPNLFIYTSKRGISRQRNHGAKKARYDNLVFLDADMRVSKNTLTKLEKHFRKKTNFTAVPFLLPYDGKMIDIPLAAVGYLYFILVQHKHPILSGMCIVTTKEVHERIGGFNENVTVAEDIDYGLRAHDSGAKYYILFDLLVKGSARRFDKTGRLNVAKMWAKWYWQTVKSGPLTDSSQYDYEFGKFKKS
jgi:glycosyltransferase involved in cell wall biosynthesis